MNRTANFVPIVISGPSGAGKSSVIKRAKADMPGMAFAVSATDRLPRPAETDGEDYFFVSPKKFDDLIRQGHLLSTLFWSIATEHSSLSWISVIMLS